MCKQCGKASLSSASNKNILTIHRLLVTLVLVSDIGRYILVNGLINVLIQIAKRTLLAVKAWIVTKIVTPEKKQLLWYLLHSVEGDNTQIIDNSNNSSPISKPPNFDPPLINKPPTNIQSGYSVPDTHVIQAYHPNFNTKRQMTHFPWRIRNTYIPEHLTCFIYLLFSYL
jgi:hypothetical protein